MSDTTPTASAANPDGMPMVAVPDAEPQPAGAQEPEIDLSLTEAILNVAYELRTANLIALGETGRTPRLRLAAYFQAADRMNLRNDVEDD